METSGRGRSWLITPACEIGSLAYTYVGMRSAISVLPLTPALLQDVVRTLRRRVYKGFTDAQRARLFRSARRCATGCGRDMTVRRRSFPQPVGPGWPPPSRRSWPPSSTKKDRTAAAVAVRAPAVPVAAVGTTTSTGLVATTGG